MQKRAYCSRYIQVSKNPCAALRSSLMGMVTTMKTSTIWDELISAARRVQNPRAVSELVEAGDVAAALQTSSGSIFSGVCIDTACSLGMCAERNAIAHMVTEGEGHIVRLVVLMPDGSVGMPCGACRELMMQLGGDAAAIEILADANTYCTVRLADLLPTWWS